MSKTNTKSDSGPVFRYLTEDNDGRKVEVSQPVDGLTAGYIEDLEYQNDLLRKMVLRAYLPPLLFF